MKRIALTALLVALLAGTVPAHGVRKAMTFENWLFWWTYNRADILNVKERIDAPLETSGGLEVADHRMTRAIVIAKIVPALDRVIANREFHPDIRGAALIALARARPAGLDAERFTKIAAAESGEDKLVRESAVLALAIVPCRGEKARAFLLSLVANRDEPIRLRCFAMLALGLLGDPTDEVFTALAARLDGTETKPDAPVCALAAMGLIGDSRRVPTLLGWLSDGRVADAEIPDLTMSWIVAALGKIGDPRAAEAVAAHLVHSSHLVRRSAAIAMGRLVPGLPRERHMSQVQRLELVHGSEKDVMTGNFVLLSLGRIGAARRTTSEARGAAKLYLARRFREGGKDRERPFAALALGLLGRAAPRSRQELAGLIRPELARLKGDKLNLGALAIALGMLEDRDSIRLLRRIVAEKGLRPWLRGCAATSVAMIGSRTARVPVLSALREREDRDLRTATATAAGMLGDPRGAEHLIGVLAHPKSSQFCIGSATLALGPLGDRRAVDPMLAILEAGKTEGMYPDLTRALVVVALGQMADRRPLRVLFRLSRDINYRASVPALDEILCIL